MTSDSYYVPLLVNKNKV